nr:hypothetical protein [Tanacetum cinerariifolium]
ASPTPTPTRVSLHRRTARMAVRTQPTLSSGMSARIAEAAALFLSYFRKTYRSSYETSSSSSLSLPIRKRYRGTFELILDTNDESSSSDDEGHGLDDDDHGLDDEGHGLEDKGPGSQEEETAPEGRQQVVLVVDTVASDPLGLGYEALRCHELALGEGLVPSTFEVGQSSRSV